MDLKILQENSEYGWSTDELSKNAHGGTENMKRYLWNNLDPDVRDSVNIICTRVREIDPKKPNILWVHDLWQDPEVQHLKEQSSRDRFSSLVFVSQWQWESFYNTLGIPADKKIAIIKNAIVPIEDHEKPDINDGVRFIYHTTPHRGLEILVPVFQELAKEFPNIHLDVFSSFEAYGWKERDEPYRNLFNICENHPNISYHGFQPNNVVREALKKSHIFAYPSIWQETSCIAAIEAMSAKCEVFVPNLAALPETVYPFGNVYQWQEDKNEHAKYFYALVRNYLLNINSFQEPFRFDAQKALIDDNFSWDYRIIQWTNFINYNKDIYGSKLS